MSSISPLSSTWVTQLVNQAMMIERRPLATLESQRDTLNVKSAIYTDINSKIDTLRTAIANLNDTSYGVTNAFAAKSVSVVNADTNVNVANVTLSGSTAVAGTYDLTVSKLAQSQQIKSRQIAQPAETLGYTGSFVIGGAATRSVSGTDGDANPLNDTTPFTTATLATGEKELGSGSYYVEFRQNESSTWQFRLVDSNGDAVRIKNAADTDSTTSNWQNFDQTGVKGATFDTGRGLQIAFDNVAPSAQQLKGDTNTARADYVAQGATVTVATTDSLNDIRDNINAGIYAGGNEVQATVVDGRLVLTGLNTGADKAISMSDTTGSSVLQDLDILANAGGTLETGAQLRAAQNAEFTLNGISISRSKNTGLTNVVQGLNFDLKKAGSSTVTVSQDQSGLVDKVKSMLTGVNDLISFLKAKTEATVGNDDAKGNPTYTAAPLGSDWNMRWLKQEIATDMLTRYTGAVGNAPAYLIDVGISLNDNGEFSLSDSSALTDALNGDFSGVQTMFSNLLGNLDDRLAKYVDGSGAILTSTKTNLESELTNLNDQISSYEKRLTVREETLTMQYSAVQSQLLSMTYQYQSMQAFSSSYSSLY